VSTFADYYVREAIETTRATIVGYAKAANLVLTNFIKGSTEEQFLETMTQSANNAAAISSQLVRGRASLDTSTDPGDSDPYDPTNANATPAPGMLSDMGAGNWGTPRLDETFAEGTWTFTNASGAAVDIAPEQVSFALDTDSAITYRNKADATVYTNPNGTATIPNGGTLDVPIIAEQKGIGSNAGAGQVLLVTTIATGVSGSNAASVVASVREDADAYRARCRAAPAFISPNGPSDAYRTIATRAFKTDAGEVLFFPPWGDQTTGIGVDASGLPTTVANARGTPLGITRVYVSKDSSTGVVTVYFATADGAASGGDVSDLTALLNVTYWPDATTRSLNAASEVTIDIAGTIYAKPGAGVSSGTILAAVTAELTKDFPGYDIGGFNQTAGAGTIYKQELESSVNAAHASIYKVTLTSPVGDVSLSVGEVAVLGSTAGLSVVIA
jgi:hypothetical protein